MTERYLVMPRGVNVGTRNNVTGASFEFRGLPGNVSAPALRGRLLAFAAPESDWGERPRRGASRVEGGHES